MLIIRSKLLSRYPNVVFGMSTRLGGFSLEPLGMNLSYSVGDRREDVDKNRERFFGALNISGERVAFPRQIHSGTVNVASVPGDYENCDALISNLKDVYLSVSIADCVPIFLYDPVAGSVAAVHSGWRGCKSGIVGSAIRRLETEFGVLPSNLVAYIGSSAGVCCYEVGEEVASAFDRAFVRREVG
ncbi:MAG TPA: polyphenol oxidase family protein, partial [Bacteroidota bacterium]|nr:polyphenol oxidase family protein [Bacteroidota bacterium]